MKPITTPTGHHDKKQAPVSISEAKADARIDAGLLLAKMEDRILREQDTDRVREMLKKEHLWKRLDVPARLQWSELAQMAGDSDTALAVLEDVNRTSPDGKEGWHRRLDLLSILGRAKELSRALARARKILGEEACRRWTAAENSVEPDADIDAASAPFEQRQKQMAAVERYLSLFAGREDCFARQWADRSAGKSGYVPVRHSLGPSEAEEHFFGRRTYGIYLMQSDGRVRTAVIDADLHKKFREPGRSAEERRIIRKEAAYLVSRIRELSTEADAYPLLEFSGGKGYHFWFFFESPVDPAPVREALNRLVALLKPDLSAFGLEVFPKQDRLGGKGFGNLVKLPLGVHRLTGKRSFFPSCANRSVQAQLDFLAEAEYSNPEQMITRWSAVKNAEVLIHPRWKQWADEYPALYRLQTCCPPLAQVMSMCMEGGNISLREEKILFQTVGFLPDGKRMLHHLLSHGSEYNSHLVDYRISRIRGTPLGCKRIHSLTGFAGDWCRFAKTADYLHPLLHIEGWQNSVPRSEKTENLSAALIRLQEAIGEVERFLR